MPGQTPRGRPTCRVCFDERSFGAPARVMQQPACSARESPHIFRSVAVPCSPNTRGAATQVNLSLSVNRTQGQLLLHRKSAHLSARSPRSDESAGRYVVDWYPARCSRCFWGRRTARGAGAECWNWPCAINWNGRRMRLWLGSALLVLTLFVPTVVACADDGNDTSADPRTFVPQSPPECRLSTDCRGHDGTEC